VPPAPKRLQWKCRRGTREMDILLARFLERGYDALDGAQRNAFERLLERPDQELLAWLSGTSAPPQDDLAALVERIRERVSRP